MNSTVIAEIKACEGIYRAADVARHYGVHPSTVTLYWQGRRRADISPAPDFPDIQTRLYGSYLHEEIQTRLKRGMTVSEVANALGINERTVYLHKVVVFV